jgi:hypothetical protein
LSVRELAAWRMASGVLWAGFESRLQLLVVLALHLFREFGIFLCALRRRIDGAGISDCQDNPVTDPQLPLEPLHVFFPDD